jgi:hypothetical protein
MKYRFAIQGKYIACWNGDEGWTKIAEIIEGSPCKQLLKFAQAGEDVEELIDKLLGETSGVRDAVCSEVEV